MTQYDLHDRHVVVTGGSSGIGAEVVQIALDSGAQVTNLDRSESDNPNAKWVQVDLADPASIDAAVSQIEQPVNALLNVAGVPGTAPPDVVMSVNFLGLRHLTNQLLPLIESGGAIVNVASIAGLGWMDHLEEINALLDTPSFEAGREWLVANPRETGADAYSFSKEVVIMYTKRLAENLRSRGVRANSVSPGVVETPILDDFKESMGVPMITWAESQVGRHATPADIAPIVVFLATDAAQWINGLDAVVDGGLTAGTFGGWLDYTNFA